MSTIKISPMESKCSLPLFPKANEEKQITFEVKSNTFNRKVEVKTKQEETICSTKKFPPTITCSSTDQVTPSKSTVSNSSIQSVRVSVNALPSQTEIIKTTDGPTVACSSSIIVEENDVDQEKENFARRPLLDLLNQLKEDRKTHSPSPSRILPPKQILPFRPVITHKKYQEPIGRFDLISLDDSSSTGKSLNDCSSLNSDLISISGMSNPTPTSSGTIDDKNEARRKAIAMQMYDTEKSYVEALKNLVTKYYLPMKDKDIVSNDLINDIFYKIPEIHIHHTAFLISLSQKLTQWDNKQTVGDLLLQMFTRTSVIETYTSFVNNYKTAQIAIRLCRDFSSFNKFLEQQARDHRGKLTLRDLIIQPVQRIPRYELYLKDFLKCTNLNHPDYQLLLKAQSEIHSLAEQIDQVQKEVYSTDLNVNDNSLEVVQEMIENLTDLVNPNRYYIRHDLVILQFSSGVKKDRCLFLFNDLIIITSSKRRNATLTKKTSNSIIVNSPSGKQYIDNAKHKLIMKISLENVDLTTDQLKKRGSSISSPPALKKSPLIVNSQLDRHRHLQEDLIVLEQMTDLAKTIITPHQHLDDSIKDILNNVNKHLLEEETIPEIASNNVQLMIKTGDRFDTIDVLFSSLENKLNWEKNFLEAKKLLLENSSTRKSITFEHVLTLPHHRPGSQFTCGTIRSYSNDLCLCNTEGEICLLNIQSNIELKSSSSITSSKINWIESIPAMKSSNLIQHLNQDRRDSKEGKTSVDSLLDYNSSEDDEQENVSLTDYSMNSLESYFKNEEEDTVWLGTDNGGLFVYDCSQTMKNFGRKNRIFKQFNSAIHSIRYFDQKVFLALNHRQLCVLKRDLNGRWDLDNPTIKIIDENSCESSEKSTSLDNEENINPISVMSLVDGQLWCGIRDRIFVVCPNSLTIQHSFIVDDYHRHICSIVPGDLSMHHVWIALQDSHEIRLYHSINFLCLFEFSIKTLVAQKLQVCDDIIRAHKLGCLHVTTLHFRQETLWIGTSAGMILYWTISQLIDSLSMNKLSPNSIQLECLSFGHAGPVRFLISNIEQGNNELIISMGDGFENFIQNEEHLGKDDALSHLIFWKF